MARPASAHPTEAELDILKVLWDAGPSELGKIVTGVNESRAVASTTVATTLRVMVEKGWIERTQGPRGYQWTALVSREETSSGLIRRLVDRVFDGSAGRLVARLVEDGEISAKDRDEIRRLLERSDAKSNAKGGKA